MRKYLFLEVFLPALLVFIIWMPAGLFGLSNESHLFYKVFATGDLLPVCLLILINAFLRLDRTNVKLLTSAASLANEADRKAAIAKSVTNGEWRALVSVFAAALFLLYYIVKVAAIPYPFPKDEIAVEPRIIYYAIFDIAAFVFVSILGCVVHRFGSD